MKAFGFSVEEESSGPGEWRVSREHYEGTVSLVKAGGHGLGLQIEAKYDPHAGVGQVHLISASGPDSGIHELTHKYPMFRDSTAEEGKLCHELAFPNVGATERPWSSRVTSLEEIEQRSPDFAAEMATLGVEIGAYEDAVGPTDHRHSGHLCVVLDQSPLLMVAVFLGEKVVPYLLAP